MCKLGSFGTRVPSNVGFSFCALNECGFNTYCVFLRYHVLWGKKKTDNRNVYLFLLGIIISNKKSLLYIHTYTHTHTCSYSAIQISCHSKVPAKGQNNMKKNLSVHVRKKINNPVKKPT